MHIFKDIVHLFLIGTLATAVWKPNYKPEVHHLSDRIANYNIQVSLDAQHKTLHGLETVEWRNPGKIPVSELYFHMYPNAFESEHTTFMTERLKEGKPKPESKDVSANMTIERIETGQGLSLMNHMQFVQPDDGNVQDRTLLKIRLPYSVPPEGTIKMALQFTVQLPHLHRRMGYADDFVMAGQWFPKLAVYEPSGTRGRLTEGWNLHQYHANSEFYADFGSYDVFIDCPSNNIVAATGAEISAEPLAGGRVRHHFHADDVHDFAWAASPNLILSEGRGNPETTIKLYLDANHAHLKNRYVQASKAALTAYEEWFGKYPYSTLSVVVPPKAGRHAGGMEYPTFITVAAANEDKPNLHLELVVAHEIAHQYWYGMVANNEFEEAWLDEAFATYTEDKFMKMQYGFDTNLFYRPYSPTYNRLTEYSWRYKNRADYENNVYIGGKHVLQDIERQIGSDKMQEVMKVYFETWKFKHPGTKDFMDVLEKETGRSWQSYFDSHVYGKP